MVKNLNEILCCVDVVATVGTLDRQVTGITSNSLEVEQGNIFVAVTGFKTNGAKYIPNAIEKGASVIVVGSDCDYTLDENADVTLLKVVNARRALSKLACNFYDDPSKDIFVIGITGTKGKTTTTFMVQKIFQEQGMDCALIGGLGGFVNQELIFESIRTTDESYKVQKFMYDAKKMGCKVCVVEVSSQAMILDRVTDIDFDITAFTNIGKDHISEFEHPDFEDYFNAKKSLLIKGKSFVYNIDDKEVATVVLDEKLQNKKRVAISILNDVDGTNDISEEILKIQNETPTIYTLLSDIKITNTTSEFPIYMEKDGHLTKENFVCNCKIAMPGIFSIYNALVAIAVANIYGIDIQKAAKALEDLKVRGRMEQVENDLGLDVLIDYAHTAESLESVLQTINKNVKGRLICLFGTSGSRDPQKRPLMGEISGKYADYTILTSDQIRDEEPLDIILDIEKGIIPIVSKDKYEIVVDRKDAIKRGMEIMNPEDTLLLAGMGHEMYIEIKGEKFFYDEREVVKNAAKEIIRQRNS